MELSPRKRAVLNAIIKEYIKTGEPVGSKLLTEMIENAPSSATLRNEMSELCSLGFLIQPHTSSGRVPTSNALRLYVNSLMPVSKLSSYYRQYIDDEFADIHSEAERIPAFAGKVLSRITRLPVITTFVADKSVEVQKVDLMPVNRNTAILLLVTSDGRARNRIFRLGTTYTPELSRSFKNIITEKINGISISNLTKAYIQKVVAFAGINSFKLLPLLTAVFEMVNEIQSTTVNISGASYLYNICSCEEDARKVMSLVEMQQPILSLFEKIETEVGIIFGNDIDIPEFKNHTIIAAKYKGSNKYRGTIGLIGPNRMSYDIIIPGIEYIANKLSDILIDAQKDMED